MAGVWRADYNGPMIFPSAPRNVGDRVVIQGLQSKPELNGCSAHITGRTRASLSVANVGAHLLVAAISFAVLHVYVNTAIVLGFVITLGALLGYVYVVFRQGVGFDETRQGPNCCEVITSWFTQQLHGRRDAPTAVGHPVDDEAALPSKAEEREAKKT